MTIEENRAKHVILYAMLRWFSKRRDREYHPVAPDIVVTSRLMEDEYPVRFYGRGTVDSYMNNLKEAGYIETARYEGKTLGYRLAEKGLKAVEEMGVPKQYNH